MDRRLIKLAVVGALLVGTAAYGQGYLLIPESTNDTIGKYDAQDGTYLGVFANVPLMFGSTSTPINAALGPGGLVYCSDQVQDAIFRFDLNGNFVDVYADGSDGLNNIRGIDFRGGNVFVTSGDDYVAEFNGPHSRLADFIADGTDPFDILFLPDGRSLMADIQGTTDNVRLYDANGVLQSVVFNVNFPEQVQFDSVLPGAYLNAAFSANVITDFDLDGTIHSQFSFSGGRGVYRLGNGNLLATAGDGVWELDAVTGAQIENENPGVSGRFIEFVPEPASALLLLGVLAFVRRR